MDFKERVLKIASRKKPEKLSWKKAALFLKDGAIGVIPTDTIYGLCASALDKKAVEKVYRLKKRDPKKPMIILIGSLDDLRKFNIDLNAWQKKILKKVWPGKVSVVLPCSEKRFAYLHKGTKTLAFRLPKKRELLKILSISGPLAAPSANREGQTPSKNIAQAQKYFGKNVFYYGKGDLTGAPSTLIDLTQKTDKIKILRESKNIKSVIFYSPQSLAISEGWLTMPWPWVFSFLILIRSRIICSFYIPLS